MQGYSVAQREWPLNEIHTTHDGGLTWKRVFVTDDKGEFWPGDVQAVSANEAWAGSYHTDDGGETWLARRVPGSFPFFLNPEIGWSINDDTVWKTETSGKKWVRIGTLPHALDERFAGGGDLFFADALHGWFVEGRQAGNEEGGELSSIVLYTEDGGVTWQSRAIIKEHYAWSVFFLNEHQGWTGGTNGSVLASSDGGKTWTRVTPSGIWQ